MDVYLWLVLNIVLIDWSIVIFYEVKVKIDIDLYYYLYMLKFFLNYKLFIFEYGKVEKVLIQEYIIKYLGIDICWYCKLNYFIYIFIIDIQIFRLIQFNKFFVERDNIFI